jgi:hypothetical protein
VSDFPLYLISCGNVSQRDCSVSSSDCTLFGNFDSRNI